VRDPEGLFTVLDEVPDLGSPVLVQAMDGFVDAGHAVRLAREHILALGEAQPLVSFDVDQLIDYRARRPQMIFATDHWQSYDSHRLEISLVRDQAGTIFLVLSGPEPDGQWERFTAAVEHLCTRLNVRLIIGLDAIPIGVPHTRPSSVIAHGNPRELVSDYNAWLGTVQVPASAGHLLEFRLGEAGLPSMGFAVNVPHYLAHLDYPEAARTLVECVGRAGDLTLPTVELVEAAAEVRANVDRQVEASPDVAGVVRALEEQYDEVVAGRSEGLVAEGAPLPTAEELGAEFERYLARREHPDGPPEAAG
jgi:predicted ATP-grasp superfamily ATP-dependent carboligase